jgi:hypothetical protein
MARPIRETPILFGEDARRFIKRMNEKRQEDPEKKARRLENYKTVMAMLERGEREHKQKYGKVQ